MRLRGILLLCAAVGIFAMVSDAYGQVPGGLDKSTVEQARREAMEQQALELAQKEALAESIIAQEEMQSGREFDPAHRAQAKQALASLSLSVLEAQKSREGLGTNALGDSQADLVYTPVTPCRIIDTRLAGGTLSAGVPRSFKVTGDTTLQGGANCGIPYGPATSAMINFVAVSPAGLGNMKITPFGQAMPVASFINYSAGLTLANGLAVALCNPSAATCTFDVTIQANNSAVDLVADVQGYFRKVQKEQVNNIVVKSTSASTTLIAGGTCTNYSGGQITVTAPTGVAGKVLVRADVVFWFAHTGGILQQAAAYLGTGPTLCNSAATGVMYATVPAQLPSANYFPLLSISGLFNVAAGSTTTFYLNGVASDATTQNFYYSGMDATFTPN